MKDLYQKAAKMQGLQIWVETQFFVFSRIDPKEAVSDIIWDTAETLVHRATLMETQSVSDG